MNFVAIAPILVPLLGAVILLLIPTRRAGVVAGVNLLVHLTHCFVAFHFFTWVQKEGVIIHQIGGWPAPFGIGILADGFSSLMVAITAFIGLATGIYSTGTIPHSLVTRRYYPLLQLLLAGVSGAFISADLFNLFVWFEVLLMASFVLLTLGSTRVQVEAGVKYLTINFLASMIFLAAAGLAFAETGTLSMPGIGAVFSSQPPSNRSLFIAALLLTAFGVKAGVFPVYSWLPASYHAPPPAIAAIFAGLLTKVGVYALYRSSTMLFPNHHEIAAPLFLFIGVITMLTGVLGAVAQMDIRKVLSFHIISQIGYMVFALGLWSSVALAAGIFYIIHHIIVKANLFFLSGIAQALVGSSRLSEMGGLYKRHPYIAILFLIPALSLSGVPPLSGFFAKFSLLKIAIEQHELPAAIVALAVGLLTLFSMTKIWNEAFWKPREANEMKVSVPSMAAMVSASIILASGTVIIGLFPQSLFIVCTEAAEQLLTPELYLQTARVLP